MTDKALDASLQFQKPDPKKSTDRLSIWREVQETPPNYTKQFNRGGGFKGTATNPTFLAMRATELFGPMGIGWGIDIVDEELMQGAPIFLEDGHTLHEMVHKVRVKLWYVWEERKGEIYQFGQTTFVGKNKYGPYTDEEAPKKSITDAMSKCLSLLGFSADIHLGLYDDNKYVNNLKHKQEEDLAKKMAEKAEQEAKANLEACAAALEKAARSGGKTAFTQEWKNWHPDIRGKITPDEVKKLQALCAGADAKAQAEAKAVAV